jgi:hypothetical protein
MQKSQFNQLDPMPLDTSIVSFQKKIKINVKNGLIQKFNLLQFNP